MAVTGRVRCEAAVARRTPLGDGLYELVFAAPEVARAARPGQFLHVRCLDDFSLRRPFSVYWAEDGHVALFFDVRGRGTRALAARSEGDAVDLLGPLGNPFTLAARGERCLLVAGGIGFPPLCFLAERLLARGAGVEILYGARNAARLAGVDRAAARGIRVTAATEDGSAGHRGLVTALLADRLAAGQVDRIYACGPNRMLAAVAELAAGLPAELALEAQMGCGLGVCLACVVPTRQGYLRVCTEGPVFPAEVPAFDQITW